jgi:hypothetical protein
VWGFGEEGGLTEGGVDAREHDESGGGRADDREHASGSGGAQGGGEEADG